MDTLAQWKVSAEEKPGKRSKQQFKAKGPTRLCGYFFLHKVVKTFIQDSYFKMLLSQCCSKKSSERGKEGGSNQSHFRVTGYILSGQQWHICSDNHEKICINWKCSFTCFYEIQCSGNISLLDITLPK